MTILLTYQRIINSLNSYNDNVKGLKEVNVIQVLKKIYFKEIKLNVYQNLSLS